jgi:tetratricopeptide (TPR) repeat protein
VILFAGGVAGNLIASYLQTSLEPYRRWVWLMFVIALVVTVVAAIVEARRRDDPPVSDANAEKSPVVNDYVGRDKIINIQQAATVTGNALHQLRAPVGDFVGREQEIDKLIAALRRDSRASITGISGMGGIGKTELALFVADRLSNEYPDAQFFINLQGTDANPRPPQEVMTTCIRAFRGLEATLPEDLDQLSQIYRSELSGKRVLLLLDNAGDSKQVHPLLPPAGCALLVTSRQAIALPAMTSLMLNPLTKKEARELLLEIAPDAASAADEICKLCGHLPLAIRAAGGLLVITPDLDPVNYATQLKDERNRLERIGSEGVEINVEASFNLSYARLQPEAAYVFRLLSVFPVTFDAAAAEVVCADANHVQLSHLARRSLVLYDTNTKRYRMHDLVRLFGNGKLSAGEQTVALKRHAIHYKNILAATDDLYLRGGEALARGLALFDLEWGNIEAGHAWVAAQAVEADKNLAKLGIAYPDAGRYVLHLRQHPRERIRWLEVAIGTARRLKDRPKEGHALGNLGIAHSELGESQLAMQFHEQYLTIAREIGDRRGEGAALCNLGRACLDLGETQRAIEFHEQALLIVCELGDRRDESTVLGNLGVVYKNLGKTQRAIEFYEQQLTIAREIGDRRGEGDARGNLGSAYLDLGETQRAIQFYEQALLIDREIGDQKGQGTDLFNMSLALAQLGKRAQAIEHAEEALRIYEQIEDPHATRVRARLSAWGKESGNDQSLAGK